MQFLLTIQPLLVDWMLLLLFINKTTTLQPNKSREGNKNNVWLHASIKEEEEGQQTNCRSIFSDQR